MARKRHICDWCGEAILRAQPWRQTHNPTNRVSTLGKAPMKTLLLILLSLTLSAFDSAVTMPTALGVPLCSPEKTIIAALKAHPDRLLVSDLDVKGLGKMYALRVVEQKPEVNRMVLVRNGAFACYNMSIDYKDVEPWMAFDKFNALWAHAVTLFGKQSNPPALMNFPYSGRNLIEPWLKFTARWDDESGKVRITLDLEHRSQGWWLVGLTYTTNELEAANSKVAAKEATKGME
jgi:hypothetical protein